MDIVNVDNVEKEIKISVKCDEDTAWNLQKEIADVVIHQFIGFDIVEDEFIDEKCTSVSLWSNDDTGYIVYFYEFIDSIKEDKIIAYIKKNQDDFNGNKLLDFCESLGAKDRSYD